MGRASAFPWRSGSRIHAGFSFPFCNGVWPSGQISLHICIHAWEHLGSRGWVQTQLSYRRCHRTCTFCAAGGSCRFPLDSDAFDFFTTNRLLSEAVTGENHSLLRTTNWGRSFHCTVCAVPLHARVFQWSGGPREVCETRFAAKPLCTFKIATFKLQIAKNSLCHYRWPFCIIFAEFGAWWAENCVKFSMSLAKGLNSSLGHAVPSLLIPFLFPPLVRHFWSLRWDADGDGDTATSEWALAVCEQVSVACPPCCPSEHLHSWAIEKRKK